MRICDYCGASWDEAHERGECGVASATERLLSNYTPRVPFADRKKASLLDRLSAAKEIILGRMEIR